MELCEPYSVRNGLLVSQVSCPEPMADLIPGVAGDSGTHRRPTVTRLLRLSSAKSATEELLDQ